MQLGAHARFHAEPPGKLADFLVFLSPIYQRAQALTHRALHFEQRTGLQRVMRVARRYRKAQNRPSIRGSQSEAWRASLRGWCQLAVAPFSASRVHFNQDCVTLDRLNLDAHDLLQLQLGNYPCKHSISVQRFLRV